MPRSTWRQRYPGQSVLGILFYLSVQYFTQTLFTVFYRFRVFGLDRVPRDGACIVVCNHQSHLDPPGIGCLCTWRAMHFIAKSTLFNFGPFGWFIRNLNSIPIKQDGTADIAAIKDTLARLDQGALVLIFPEGSRSTTGKLQPFQRGVSVMLKRAQCPVIPAAIEGTFDAWRRGSKFPSLWGKRVAVSFGEPISHDELLKNGPDAALLRLAHEIETQRLELRSKLRAATRGRYPKAGPGDERAA